VCPTTLVGHWKAEIEKFFPGKEIFFPVYFSGNKEQRMVLWNQMHASANLIVTSYSILRSEVDLMSAQDWRYCVLDEGHLLKNPKTGKKVEKIFIMMFRSAA